MDDESRVELPHIDGFLDDFMASMTQQLTHVFEKRTVIATTMQRILEFHQERGALSALTPPPIFVQLIRDGRTSLTDGDLEFVLWFGPLPIRWLARHEAGPTETSFADRMIRGPLAEWRHEHIFRAVDGGIELRDRVRLAHQPGLKGLLTRLIFDGLPLKMLFLYRHWRTKRAVQSR